MNGLPQILVFADEADGLTPESRGQDQTIAGKFQVFHNLFGLGLTQLF